MTSTQGAFGASRQMSFPKPPSGDVIATYDSYEGAQQAVDELAHADFPVRSASIVGNDMKSVERVTGRLSWGRAAGAGAASGLWLGLFLGVVTLIFSTRANPGVGYLVGAVLLGAAFGILFGLVSYAATRSRRDFSSVMQVVASTYSLVVDPEVANRARNILGVGLGGTAVTPVTPVGGVDDAPDEPPTGPVAGA
ncbi:MAG TPA: general stress protein [Amnibacterium sp.]|uniref:general stress protein n=1 Tax=Amnibacterium sp. TaxID=1872496 RepID=UPI002F944985